MSDTTVAPANATRTYEGLQIPTAGRFELDLSHSEVGFSVRHLMVSKTRGRFAGFSGSVVIADDPRESTVEVTIDAASVDTSDEKRDGHLRSADFFDVDRNPTITFRSTGVSEVHGDRFTIDGELTVRGVTRPVVLDATFEGVATSPWGTQAVGFSASTELDREAFGLTWNQALETGGVLVGKVAKVEISAELVRV